MSNSKFEVNIYNYKTIPQDLFIQYGQLRYDCFEKDDPHVNMNHQFKTEFDHFDQSMSTVYIVVTKQESGSARPIVVSAMRLIPTMEQYELEAESYLYLTHDATLPKSAHIFEASRWVGKSSRTNTGMLSTGLMLVKLYQLALSRGFNQLVGTITTKGESWLNKRKGATSRNSEIYTVEKEGIDIMVSLIDINDDLLTMAKGLLLNSIDTFAITNMEIQDTQAA